MGGINREGLTIFLLCTWSSGFVNLPLIISAISVGFPVDIQNFLPLLRSEIFKLRSQGLEVVTLQV